MSITESRERNVASLRADEKRALLEKLLRERKDKRFPLSSAQKRLWFLDKLQPNSAIYNVPTVLALRGPIEIEPFRKALESVVERHRALRTVFESVDDTPFQKVNPMAPLDLPVIDLSALESHTRVQQA